MLLPPQGTIPLFRLITFERGRHSWVPRAARSGPAGLSVPAGLDSGRLPIPGFIGLASASIDLGGSFAAGAIIRRFLP